MNEKQRTRLQLECLYDMFRDRVEENVIYIVYSENEGKIDTTIDQLVLISKCSFTGHDFETRKPTNGFIHNGTNETPPLTPVATNSASIIAYRTRGKIVSDVEHQQQQLDSINKSCQTSTNVSTKQLKSSSSTKELQEQKAASNICNGKSSEVSDYGDGEEENDDDESLPIDERIDRLRDSIDYWLGEKNNCHEKSTQYLSKKMFQVTSYYSELASHYRRMIEAKTRRLLDLLLLKSRDANTIDLHGLNPIQARQLVSDLLKIRQEKLSIDKQGEASIDIITGWGKHTIHNNHHRVKPAIVALLREQRVEYNYLNKGALRVTIRR